MDDNLQRIRAVELRDRVVTAEQAASWIGDGMVLGLSGFTHSGDAKLVPYALAERGREEKFKVSVLSGASLGSGIDRVFAEAGIIEKRLPYQSDPIMRGKINEGEMMYVDEHLSHSAERLRSGVLGPVDFAIIEALAITEDGMIIPTTSAGNSAIFVEHAKNVIVEINMAQPKGFEGIHDFYEVGRRGDRRPIPLLDTHSRIGTIGIPVDLEKIKGIVFNDQPDSPSEIVPPDKETGLMAGHLLAFLRSEVKSGRLTNSLAPIQSGIGTVSNAVLEGMIDSEFEDLEVYSEVMQDVIFDLMDAGKVKFASASAITLSPDKMKQVYRDFEKYRNKLVLRPQEISNHPEIIRRLGLLSINTALEFDIYGNVNSTHVRGTKIMNGIGGSGDFARNARLSIFVTRSTAKDDKISSVVPFVSHVDHTEHDVQILVTEQGYADLRGLAPRERVPLIIENCVHPMYREQMRAYYTEALKRGGQTPHVLEKAFSWHTRYMETGTMREE